VQKDEFGEYLAKLTGEQLTILEVLHIFAKKIR